MRDVDVRECRRPFVPARFADAHLRDDEALPLEMDLTQDTEKLGGPRHEVELPRRSVIGRVACVKFDDEGALEPRPIARKNVEKALGERSNDRAGADVDLARGRSVAESERFRVENDV